MKILGIGLLVVVVLFLAIQLVPYGRNHDNPPVSAAPAWDSSQTEATFARACGDCHSNTTRWPWYSHVAPMSWLIQYDVDAGRAVFNISEARMGEAEEAAETVAEGEMPPRAYLLLHPDARLYSRDAQAFMQGLNATFGAEEGEDGHEDDD